MILPLRKKKFGFSIIEVVVAAVIFSIAAAGILAMVSSVRPKATISEREIGAALFARQILEWLRGKVDAVTWDTGNLAEGNYTITCSVGTTLYTARYTITNDIYGAGRQVNLTVNWAELE